MISPDWLHFSNCSSLPFPKPPSQSIQDSIQRLLIFILHCPSCPECLSFPSLFNGVGFLHSSPHAWCLATIVILQRRLQLNSSSLMLHHQPREFVLLVMLREYFCLLLQPVATTAWSLVTVVIFLALPVLSLQDYWTSCTSLICLASIDRRIRDNTSPEPTIVKR